MTTEKGSQQFMPYKQAVRKFKNYLFPLPCLVARCLTLFTSARLFSLSLISRCAAFLLADKLNCIVSLVFGTSAIDGQVPRAKPPSRLRQLVDTINAVGFRTDQKPMSSVVSTSSTSNIIRVTIRDGPMTFIRIGRITKKKLKVGDT